MVAAWERPKITTSRFSEVPCRLQPLAFHLRRQPKTPWSGISEVLVHMHVPPKLSYTGIPVVKKASGGGLEATEFHDFPAFGGTMLLAATCFSSAAAAENAVAGHFGGNMPPATTCFKKLKFVSNTSIPPEAPSP